MADKKITALSVATEAATEDLLHIIDDPAGSPINKRLSVKALFGNVTHSTIGTVEATQEVLLSLTHTANANYSTSDVYDNATTLQVVTEAAGGISTDIATIDNFYAADITNKINSQYTKITNESAGMRLTLDRGIEGASTVNSYALILRHTQSSTATVAPTAYLKIEDDTSTTYSSSIHTSFLLDIYPTTTFGVAASASATAGPVSADGTAPVGNQAGWLKVKVFGETRFISLYSAIA